MPELPDNEINKELKARLNNIDVGGTIFPLFDSRSTSIKSSNYIIISTQLNNPEFNKCGNGWENSTEIQVIVKEKKNVGSRELLNNATNAVLTAIEDFQLTSAPSLRVNHVELSIANEIVDARPGNVFYQKIIRMETSIR